MNKTLTAEHPRARRGPRVKPWLYVVFRDGRAATERLELEDGALVLGREPSGARRTLAFPEDARQSRSHASLRIRGDRVSLTDLESRNGVWLDGRAVTQGSLEDGAVLRLGQTILVLRLETELPEHPLPELVGSSAAIRELRQALTLVAPTEATVVLLGHSGSGKGASASALHRLSGRSGPLVAVNCAAIPDTLAESTLFGHRAGAFTGAIRDEPGLFRAAHRGTLFIDEIGDLPMALQPKLLRVLESGEVMPVGGTATVRTSARIVTATSIDLEQAVADGRFRGELWARLAQFVVRVPSLSERRQDVLTLFRAFLPPGAPALDMVLAENLLLWDWPWNVRELSNAATEVMVRGQGAARLTAAMLPRLEDQRVEEAPAEEREALDRDGLIALLTEHDGVVTAVARAAGLSRRHLYRLLEQHALEPDAYRSRAR